MPDITMCNGSNERAFPLSVAIDIIEDFECPLKNKCIRYLSNPSERQSYFIGVSYDPEKKNCEYFLEKTTNPKTKKRS